LIVKGLILNNKSYEEQLIFGSLNVNEEKKILYCSLIYTQFSTNYKTGLFYLLAWLSAEKERKLEF